MSHPRKQPDVYEEAFWVVRTPRGFFRQDRDAAGRPLPARLDLPVQEAGRLAADEAANVAGAGLEHHHEDWAAVPAVLRVEANPPAGPNGYTFYQKSP